VSQGKIRPHINSGIGGKKKRKKEIR